METTSLRGKNYITQIKFDANGISHEFQEEVTNLMHRIVMATGKFTLANLGYLHMNTCSYNMRTGMIQMKVYFLASLAARKVESTTSGNTKYRPLTELNIFKNYMFVGDLEDCVSYETVLAPRTEIITDECGHQSLVIKDSSKLTEVPALVLNCNIAILVAAITDTDVSDKNFRISCPTLGDTKKGKTVILQNGNKNEVPVQIFVEKTYDPESSGYDPAMAVPYLQDAYHKMSEKEDTRTDLEEKVRKRSNTQRKTGAKVREKENKNFRKYS